MLQFTISEHVRADRLERLTAIAMNVGIGNEIVLEVPIEDKRYCLTDTGVMLVMAITGEFLITAYLATLKQAKGYYTRAGYKVMPDYIYKKVKHNEKYLKICQ